MYAKSKHLYEGPNPTSALVKNHWETYIKSIREQAMKLKDESQEALTEPLDQEEVKQLFRTINANEATLGCTKKFLTNRGKGVVKGRVWDKEKVIENFDKSFEFFEDGLERINLLLSEMKVNGGDPRELLRKSQVYRVRLAKMERFLDKFVEVREWYDSLAALERQEMIDSQEDESWSIAELNF